MAWILERVGQNFRQCVNAKNSKQHKIVVESLDPTSTWQVGASNDDAWRRKVTDAFLLDSVQNVVGYWSSSYYGYGCGLRFTNINIPQDATIQSAYLKLRCRVSRSATAVNSRISGDDSDNAATFSTKEDFDNRYSNRTAARVDWDDIPAWALDVEYTSPDIGSVIQEIVSRAGWLSGNAVALFWEDFDNRSSAADGRIREAYSYDSSAVRAPKLEITWTSGVVKEVADGLGLSDVVLCNKSLAVSDSVAFVDASFRGWTPQVSDAFTLSETILRDKQFSVSDSLSLSELVEVVTEIIKSVGDSVGLSEQVLASKALFLADEIQLMENVYVDRILIVSDEVALAEIVEKGVAGVVKTRFFLILGDLAVQLTGD